MQRNKALHEEIQDLEDWIRDREREAPADDGPIFYQDQLRERLEQYQVKSRGKFFFHRQVLSFVETSK